MNRSIVVIAILVVSSLVAAQALPQFEVATIKPSAPITGGRVQIAMGGDPGRINYQGLPMRMLLARAFDVKDYQISGPDRRPIGVYRRGDLRERVGAAVAFVSFGSRFRCWPVIFWRWASLR